jgi:hypothetical protein
MLCHARIYLVDLLLCHMMITSFCFASHTRCIQVQVCEGDDMRVCYWLAALTSLSWWDRQGLLREDLDGMCTIFNDQLLNDTDLNCPTCEIEVRSAQMSYIVSLAVTRLQCAQHVQSDSICQHEQYFPFTT